MTYTVAASAIRPAPFLRIQRRLPYSRVFTAAAVLISARLSL
ncbi:hypothetical protein [Thiospirillum jenense]|nr:hypothetical protein [Thiospirillum jenense]